MKNEYCDKASEYYGTGTSIKCKEILKDMHTKDVYKICNKLNTLLQTCFNQELDNEQNTYYNQIENELSSLKITYLKNKIELADIKKLFEQLQPDYKSVIEKLQEF